MTGGVFRKPLQERLNLTAVTGPDLVAQVVEQIEHGQRLLGAQTAGMWTVMGRRCAGIDDRDLAGLLMTSLPGAGGCAVRCVRALPWHGMIRLR